MPCRRKTARGNTFQLHLFSCENCDERLGKYSCGQRTADGEDAENPRELLCEMAQRVEFLDPVAVDVRVMEVNMPKVIPESLVRAVWCPRCPPRSGMGKTVKRREVHAAKRSRSSSSAEPPPLPPGLRSDTDDSDGDVAGGVPRRPPAKRGRKAEVNDAAPLVNVPPQWNEEIKSLTMSFMGNRIKTSSTKNYLMRLKEGSKKPVIQFGKQDHGRFACDFRHPVAPLQAFGMFLSAFSWLPEVEKARKEKSRRSSRSLRG